MPAENLFEVTVTVETFGPAYFRNVELGEMPCRGSSVN